MNLGDLAWIDVPGKNAEHHFGGRGGGNGGIDIAKPDGELRDKIGPVAQGHGDVARAELVIIGAPNQKRQLGAEMGAQLQRDAISKSPEDRPKDMPRPLPVYGKLLHDLIEPDMGLLQGGVEDREAVACHAAPPKSGCSRARRTVPPSVIRGREARVIVRRLEFGLGNVVVAAASEGAYATSKDVDALSAELTTIERRTEGQGSGTGLFDRIKSLFAEAKRETGQTAPAARD